MTLKRYLKSALLVVGLAAASGTIYLSAQAQGIANDPYALNNGNYPSREEYGGPLTVANHDYGAAKSPPAHSPKALVKLLAMRPNAVGMTINVNNAPTYMAMIKKYLTPSIGVLVNTTNTGADKDPNHWNPADYGWYDMIWIGQGNRLPDGSIDPNSGREPIGNTYTGQIEPRQVYIDRFKNQPQGPVPTVPVQNHAVMYYNHIAASMLNTLWNNPYQPDINAIDFPDGSVVVKVEAVTTTPEQWPVTTNASIWKVYRPTVADQQNPPAGGAKAQVIDVYPIQISIAVKDKVASPTTGWVFMAFVYDASATGTTPWDRFVPLGAMWGNDPALAKFADGNNGSPANLTETYFNETSPPYVHGTRGWGGRLAGPNDVAGRQNVMHVGGNNRFVDMLDEGASSCMSCHSAAEYPWSQNLYPAPNRGFPPDGEPFVLYEPGSKEWQRWFQNLPGKYGVSQKDFPRGLDYDYAIMFALGAQAAAVGNQAYAFTDFNAH